MILGPRTPHTAVPFDLALGDRGSAVRAEVGSVAAEGLHPLLARRVDVIGDEMGCVAMAPAGHRDVGAGGAGGLREEQVGCVDRLALRSVCGGRVGELDMLIDILGRQGPVTAPACDVDREVGIESGDDPGVPVGDVELAVVAAGADGIADPEDPAVPGADSLQSSRGGGLAGVLNGGSSDLSVG